MYKLFLLTAGLSAAIAAFCAHQAWGEPEPFEHRWAPAHVMTSPCTYDTASFVKAAPPVGIGHKVLRGDGEAPS